MADPQSAPSAAPLPKGRPATTEDLVRAEAKRLGVPVSLALAVLQTESSGRATPPPSGAGAIGPMQLMPDTAKRHSVDPNDPEQNIRGGVEELRDLLLQHKGNVELALRRYNGSPQASEQATNPYVQAVMGRITGGTGGTGTTQPARGRMVAQSPDQVLTVARSPDEAYGRTTLTIPQGWKPRPIPPPPPGRDIGLVGEMLLGVDPTTATGRRNLVGGAAAAGATALAAVSGPLTALGAAAVGVGGAMLGGAGAEAGEQLVGTKPPSARAIGEASVEQGAFELGGQLLPVVGKAVGRRLVAKTVGAATHAGLQRASQATVEQLIRTAKGAEKFLARRPETAVVQELGRPLTEAELAANLRVAPSTAGRAAAKVLQGASKDAKDAVGRSVTAAAAATDTPVDITALKTAVDRMGERMTPSTRAQQPANAAVSFGGGGAGREAQERAAWEARLSRLGITAGPDHPLPGLLGEIQHLPDQISLLDAHKYKRLLDDAINWESPAKQQLKQITKGARQSLRETMRGVSPDYDAATAAYKGIAPLYTTTYVKTLLKTAIADPDALVRTLDPGKPVTARMLRTVLVEQSAQVGREAEGQRAWDLVRSAYLHNRVMQGGIDQLGEKLEKLPPEFISVVFGDARGQQVYRNLQAITIAYEQAKTQYGAFATRMLSPEQVGADIIRFIALGPGQIWGGLSGLRLAFKGPRERDLLQWAAFSTPRTQLLVKALTGTNTVGMGFADLARMVDTNLAQGPDAQTIQPVPKQVGQPPPGVPR